MTSTVRTRPALAAVVDVARYPIDAPAGTAWNALVRGVRADLAATGCSVLPDFLTPTARELAAREGAAVAGEAYVGVQTVNVYNTAADETLPADHPGRWTTARGNAFVPRDRIPTGAVIARLYASEEFRSFLAACFDVEALHRLADPLSGLCLNVVTPGRDHPWHFDVNEFTVSMLTQQPDAGGEFEFCPNIRTAHDEQLDAVREVLRGHAGGRRLALRPGDLQLFCGRYSLHRVTPVAGRTARHSAIFAYSDRPGVVGSAERARQLFGRTQAQHRAAAASVDGLLS